MVLAKKQIYQQLTAEFLLSVIAEKQTKCKSQQHGKPYVYQLPFGALVSNFFHVEQGYGDPLVSNIDQSGIVQQVIGAVH